MKLLRNIQKKSSLYVLALVIAVSSITSVFVTPAAYAAGCSPAEQEARMDFYGSSDVRPLFDPCNSGGACTATGAGSLQSQLRGGSNAEKVWNYFIGRGLSPIAAAGAMGNIEQESGFEPWIGENGNASIDKSKMGVGFGLIQWTNTDGDSQGRRYKVMKHLEDNGVRLDATDSSQNDKALILELDWLWDGEYGKATWSEHINNETKIGGNTSVNSRSPEANIGNGAALYFHASVERSADNPTKLQERIDSAQAYLEQFGGSNGSTSTVGNSKSNNCGGGGAGLTSGGANLSSAQAIMQEYITSPEVETLVGEQQGLCGGDQGWRANCVTFSKYFLRKFTTIEPAAGNGKDVVANTKAANPGTESGPTPRAYSVFSYVGGDATTQFGHTGVILAVDTTKGTMIIAEANCGAAGPREVSSQPYLPFVVREAPIAGTHPSNVEYLYTDGKQKGEIST